MQVVKVEASENQIYLIKQKKKNPPLRIITGMYSINKIKRNWKDNNYDITRKTSRLHIFRRRKPFYK